MGRPGRNLLLSSVVVLVVGPGVASAQTPVVPCDPAPAVTAALRKLPLSTGDARADRAARLAAYRALIKRFPSDIYLHQRYQDAAAGPTVADRDAIIAEYEALAAKHPKDAAYRFLALRARVGVSTKQVLPELEALAVSVPPAHLTLVQIYRAPVFRDANRMREHVEGFVKACPNSLSAYQYFSALEPSPFVTEGVAQMRALLESRRDPESFSSWTTLWSLEFRIKPVGEHDALRLQVAEDVKRLRTIDPGSSQGYYSVLQQGYKLAGDADGERWALDQSREKAPASAFNSVRSHWSNEHPYPKPTDIDDVRKTYNEAYAKATAEWTQEWPGNVSAWFDRVSALRSVVDEASASEVQTAGENLLETVKRNPDQMSFISTTGGSSFSLYVADLYAKKRILIDRLPDLVADGLAELEKPRQMGLASDLYPPSSNEDANREYNRWYGTLTVADVWLAVKDKDRARQALGRVQALALESKPGAEANDAAAAAKQRLLYVGRLGQYWQRMGDLAQLEGRKIDAMAYYQNALLARRQPPGAGEKDELGEKARNLWTEIGGSNEGWIAWCDRRDLLGQPDDAAAGSGWAKLEKKLPDFHLTDLTGARWDLAALRGKITMINVWAST
jgi:hypothetical protein